MTIRVLLDRNHITAVLHACVGQALMTSSIFRSSPPRFLCGDERRLPGQEAEKVLSVVLSIQPREVWTVSGWSTEGSAGEGQRMAEGRRIYFSMFHLRG